MTRALQPCGTRAAYNRHLDHGQVPCDACTRANAERNARQRNRRRAPSQIDRDIRQLVHVLACAMGQGRRL